MLKRIVYWIFAFTIIISEQGASVQFNSYRYPRVVVEVIDSM